MACFKARGLFYRRSWLFFSYFLTVCLLYCVIEFLARRASLLTEQSEVIDGISQDKLTRIHVTTSNTTFFENFICDQANIDRYPVSSTTSSNDTFDAFRHTSLRSYCQIVPIPRRNWSKSRSYVEQDIAFVIFTSSLFFHTRATATRDTWLSRITNYYFLSATPYPSLPLTVVAGAGDDKYSNMNKLFYGLQIIYQEQLNLSVDRRQKWFYILGCDTFVLPHHLLKRLDRYDYRQAIRIGGHWGSADCPGVNGTKFLGEFPSGGAGFFFSWKLLEIMQPHLTHYIQHVWPNTSELSDVALSCLATELGVPLTKEEGFWAHPPAFTLKENKRKKFHRDSEPNGFHYIQPDEMYALDEFYVNQHMDRLIKDRNWNEMIEFTRRFVSSHYEVLRKKRKESTLTNVTEIVHNN